MTDRPTEPQNIRAIRRWLAEHSENDVETFGKILDDDRNCSGAGSPATGVLALALKAFEAGRAFQSEHPFSPLGPEANLATDEKLAEWTIWGQPQTGDVRDRPTHARRAGVDYDPTIAAAIEVDLALRNELWEAGLRPGNVDVQIGQKVQDLDLVALVAEILRSFGPVGVEVDAAGIARRVALKLDVSREPLTHDLIAEYVEAEIRSTGGTPATGVVDLRIDYPEAVAMLSAVAEVIGQDSRTVSELQSLVQTRRKLHLAIGAPRRVETEAPMRDQGADGEDDAVR